MIQARHRIVIHRNELSLIGPGEQTFNVATQPEFLADQPAVQRLLQNAVVLRQPVVVVLLKLSARAHDPVLLEARCDRPGFRGRQPGRSRNRRLLFKSSSGAWPSGDYRLVLNHVRVYGELPITLQ